MMEYNILKVDGFKNILDNEYNSNILKLKKNECKHNGKEYLIVTYDKNYLTHKMVSTYGLFRSLIMSKENELLCFAPPKSMDYDEFKSKHNESFNELVLTEFMEGTIINVFWDKSVGLSGSWEMATKNIVGATNKFYKESNSFREMFLEVCKMSNLNLDSLNKDFCYSFVLQHPLNRIVIPIKNPKLILTNVYQIDKINFLVKEIEVSTIINDLKTKSDNKVNINIPQNICFTNYKEIEYQYKSQNLPYLTMGIVIYNKKTGERTKIRNESYEKIRNLKGNQSKLKYQYIVLKQTGKIPDYLKLFKEHKKKFSDFRDEIHKFTLNLHSNYFRCYIKKEMPLIQFSNQFRTHMFHLHKLYIDKLREKKEVITKKEVINYVNNLPPSLLMHSLNFHENQFYIDIKT